MSNTTLEPVYHKGLALPRSPFVGRVATLQSSGIVAFSFPPFAAPPPHTHTTVQLFNIIFCVFVIKNLLNNK